jgi:hypothetical protein
MELATGEFLHIATCDDAMSPEFLTEMLQAFSRGPAAGMAVSDVLLINRDGKELSPQDLVGHLTRRAARNLLSLDIVRTAFPGETEQNINHRPVPHDCLLHFDGRSVYLSLNQLVVRTALARAAGPFETTVGSVGDFSWLLRLTSSTGSVHVPKKLAMWRYHGNQLSLRPDLSRASSQRTAAEIAMRKICHNHPALLNAHDQAALLLPLKYLQRRSPAGRIVYWFESAGRLARMFFERPISTLRTMLRVKFRFGTRRHTLLPMIFRNADLKPREVETLRS